MNRTAPSPITNVANHPWLERLAAVPKTFRLVVALGTHCKLFFPVADRLKVRYHAVHRSIQRCFPGIYPCCLRGSKTRGRTLGREGSSHYAGEPDRGHCRPGKSSSIVIYKKPRSTSRFARVNNNLAASKSCSTNRQKYPRNFGHDM